jgi:hypothetical protein
MVASQPLIPFNLTAASESMLWEQACKVVSVTGVRGPVALDVRGLTYVENGRSNDGSRETVYVVVSGFGLLRSSGLDLQCTAGDVLFVPRGCPHHFERLDGDIKIWKISPVTP